MRSACGAYGCEPTLPGANAPRPDSLPALIVALIPPIALIPGRAVAVRLMRFRAVVAMAPRPVVGCDVRRGAAEHGAATAGKLRPLALEAGDDAAHVRDVARAQPEHVGHAGRLLIGGPAELLRGRAARTQQRSGEQYDCAAKHRRSRNSARPKLESMHHGPPPRRTALGRSFFVPDSFAIRARARTYPANCRSVFGSRPAGNRVTWLSRPARPGC